MMNRRKVVETGVALTLILMLCLVPITVHAEVWPDLQMTYGLQSACEPLRPAILDAITAWENWLPRSTWTETDPAKAEVTFRCEVPYNPPSCSGLALACVLTVGPVNDHDTIILSITGLATPMGEYSIDQADRDIIAHEIGHVMGLKDGAGSHACPGESLMTDAFGCEPPPSSPDGVLWTSIPSPGEDLLAILRATYGITTETTTATADPITTTTETAANMTETTTNTTETTAATAETTVNIAETTTTIVETTTTPEFPFGTPIILAASLLATMVLAMTILRRQKARAGQ